MRARDFLFDARSRFLLLFIFLLHFCVLQQLYNFVYVIAFWQFSWLVSRGITFVVAVWGVL